MGKAIKIRTGKHLPCVTDGLRKLMDVSERKQHLSSIKFGQLLLLQGFSALFARPMSYAMYFTMKLCYV